MDSEHRKSLVIIPTYNESENIPNVLKIVFDLEIEDLDVLIIDDNSPDGTAEIVKKLREENPRIHILQRAEKMGLGTAYVMGFGFALENGYEYIFEMDADLSHDPREIPNFLNAVQDNDLVIGSRYLTGVNVINWPLRRLFLSVFASKYTRLITGMPLTDCTGGFKCFRRDVLRTIPLDNIKSNGYSFQIEMNFKVWKKGFKIKEIPIIFHEREIGTSKMNKKIVVEAAILVWKLKLMSILGKY